MNDPTPAIRVDLRTISDHYPDTLNAPTDRDESGIYGPATSKPPIPVHLLDARAEAYNDLHFWCRFILHELRDGTITTGPRTNSVPDMCEYVSRWAQILVDDAPDDAANLAKEMRGHARRIEWLAKGWRVRRVHVGICPEQKIEGEPGQEQLIPCAGTLIATLTLTDTIEYPNITCSNRLHEWEPRQYPALGRKLGNAEVDLPTELRALLEGVTPSAIRARAHRERQRQQLA